MKRTVKNLIEELSKLPQDALVLVDGYEGGYSDIALIKQCKVELNVNENTWDGPHDIADNANVEAVILRRS